MKLDTQAIGVLLKSRGLHMSRAKYQRPEVHLWVGKSGQKFWRGEWRVYIEGRPKPKHRVVTWICSEYTKAAAQEECDQLVRDETSGPARPDGSVTTAEFWERVFYPVRKQRVSHNTQRVRQELVALHQASARKARIAVRHQGGHRGHAWQNGGGRQGDKYNSRRPDHDQGVHGLGPRIRLHRQKSGTEGDVTALHPAGGNTEPYRGRSPAPVERY